ncbi:MAG TPA: hypothetical protein VFB06_33935 [Streptosporangiaceae bacterium]|nr:hypothetical protein [Streptosporangiaceae bacterium]
MGVFGGGLLGHRVVARAAAVAVAVACLAGFAVGWAGPGEAASCLPSGTDADIAAALTGTGAQAVLCPGAVFTVAHTVRFTAPGQEIYTQGLPDDASRAVLRITSSDLTTAVSGLDQPDSAVKSIQVDGNMPALGQLSGGALVEMGGSGTGQVVQDIAAYNTRSWSTLHLFEGVVSGNVPQCQGAQILDNTIGPAGTASPAGNLADGISLGCGHSLVQGNTVTDATDGAIVVFGAPGSTIKGNTIVADSQRLLGGINMVDYAPVNGNYSGTTVTGNVIDGKGAYIEVGIGMGPQIWGCGQGWQGTNYGGAVTGNLVEGENVGYGYAVNGVTDWTITANTDTARHVGVVSQGCGTTPAQPAAFLVQSATSSTLQPGFASGNLDGVVGVSEPDILSVGQPPADCTFLESGQALYPDQSLASCDGRFHLILQLDGNLVLYQGASPLWATATNGTGRAVAIMQDDGNFVIYDATGHAVWATGTAGHPGAYAAAQDDGNFVIYEGGGHPLWATGTGGR